MKYLNQRYIDKILENEYNNFRYDAPKEIKVTVNEHKAPTDDSIKLYDEMFNKVLGRIIDAQVCNDNTFSYSYLIYETMSSTTFVPNLEIIFKTEINGNKYEIKRRVPDLVIQEAKLVTENGVQKIKYKFNENELCVLRLKMLVDIIIKEMYNLDNDKFNKLIENLDKKF